MSVKVTCECGHVTELADHDQSADSPAVAAQVCAACGRALVTHAPAGKRMFQQLWQSHVGDASEPSVPMDAASEIPREEPVPLEPNKPRRSLWDVMRGSPVAPGAAISSTAESTGDATKPKGLWGVMHSVPTAPPGGTPTSLLPPEESARLPNEVPRDERKPVTIVTSTDANRHADSKSDLVPTESGSRTAHETQSLPATATLTPEQKYAQAASLASMTHVRTSWQPESVAEQFAENEREWSRRAVLALASAVVTVFMAALSYRPEWWWRAPALTTGLVAVLLGIIAAFDVRQSRGRLKGQWVARASILMGTFGMFLAPLVFAQLGERQRENLGREEIHWRLRRIGQGLDQFHAQQGHYPEAALKGRDTHGDIVPLHGWMTPLLPLLGHDGVLQKIDLKQPFDALANVPAMQQTIPEYTLPHRKPGRSPRGFGLTHFSGVGGQDVREPTGLVHLGLFNDRGSVKRDEFTDGLGQTIIVGEIRDAFPPWGEPGNVRFIGEGLNRQFRGFGNATGTGATFLHADGSVKFYSNKIDRRVLERLETRDGGERE